MDYEKKYKEAFERARNVWRFSSDNAEIMRMEELFPELNKSEDNMIKEELIKHLKDGVEGYMPAGDSEDYARWLAWLEKQGKETSEKEFTFKALPRLLDMIEPTDRAKSYCKKLIDSLQTEGYSVDAKIVGKCLKQMNGEKVAMAVMDTEKQDEQKPQRMVSAEAKEALYDKPTDAEMKELLRTEYEKGRADTLSEMKSSWSEEDERICRNIVNDIANDKSICKYEISKRICDEQINWLKSLKQRIGG